MKGTCAVLIDRQDLSAVAGPLSLPFSARFCELWEDATHGMECLQSRGEWSCRASRCILSAVFRALPLPRSSAQRVAVERRAPNHRYVPSPALLQCCEHL